MEQPTQQESFRRSPFEIIGECFSIYGKHFRQIFLIALIIQVIIGAIGFAVSDSLPNEEDFQALIEIGSAGEQEGDTLQAPPLGELADLLLPFTVYVLITFVLETFMGGVIIYGVAMQYATGVVDIGRSYSRAWWRVLTLVALGLLLFGLVVLTAVGFALLILPGIAALALIIYWSVDVQAAVIEGRKPIAALRRSFELVRGNWWRTFAAWALIVLVVFGMSLLVVIPLGILAAVGGSEGIAGRVIENLISTVAGAITTPLPAIAAALIYLDLRARKEEYDIETLSQELGFAPRGGR